MTSREHDIVAFLARNGWDKAARSPIGGNASTRQYTRLTQPDGKTGLLVESGDPSVVRSVTDLANVAIGPFIQAAEVLRQLDMSVPQIYAQDSSVELMIVEDFGEGEFHRLLKAGHAEAPLFELAADTLAALRKAYVARQPDVSHLPHYTPELFISYLDILTDTYIPLQCGKPLEADALAHFRTLWHKALSRLSRLPETLILRDFGVSNLIHLPERQGIHACGLIDFQMAGPGPALYDLVSLLISSRYPVKPELAALTRQRYLSHFPEMTEADIDESYAILGAMRQAHWAGFCVRYASQGKIAYYDKLPEIWQRIETALQHPVMSELKEWFDQHIPHTARRAKEVAA